MAEKSNKIDFSQFIIIITVVSAAVMELVDTSIVNVAINQISGSLGASIEDIAWVITSYAIANVIIIPITGFLSNFFGRKNYYVSSIIIFTIASYLCGNATSLWELVFFRFIQGIGGGALLSVSQSILYDTFPIEKRPMASAFFGMGIVLGPSLGPTLGGIIIDHIHWSWIFYINIPIGILATFLSITYVKKQSNEFNIHRKKFDIDIEGLILLIVGIGTLQYVLERGETEGWFESKTILWTTITSISSIILFIIWELYTDNPIVDLRVLKNRNLAVSSILTFVVGYGMFSSVFLYPLLAQRIAGFTPTMTGESMILGSFIAVLIMPFIGKGLAAGTSPRIFVFFGIIFFAIYSFMMSKVDANTSTNYYIPVIMLRGIGMSMLMVPLINIGVSTLKHEELQQGVSLNNMIRQIGGSVGIAITNTYVANRFAVHKNDLISNINMDNPNFIERANSLTQSLISKGINSFDTQTVGLKITEIAILKQSYLLAYLDTFLFVAIFFICSLPLIFLVKDKKMSTEDMKKVAESAH